MVFKIKNNIVFIYKIVNLYYVKNFVSADSLLLAKLFEP